NITKDVHSRFDEDDTVGVIFPILNRNRFSNCLRVIAKGVKKIALMLRYPADEVGNRLLELKEFDEKGINPLSDVLTEKEFREHFSNNKHAITGVDYIDHYKEVIASHGIECEVIFSNNPRSILDYTKIILTCDIHARKRTKNVLKLHGGEKVYSL